MKSSTQTLIRALEILALEIKSDGVANAAIAEAAGRLAELECAASERDELKTQARLLQHRLQNAEARITQFMSDIAYVSNRVVDLEYERDALAAQVSRLHEVANYYMQGQVPSDESMNEIIYRISETPAQCLREIRAEAGRAGFMEASRYDFERLSDDKIIKIANDYAAKVRQV